MRRALHALLVILAGPWWLIACLTFGVSVLLVLAADKLIPDADRGNCWSYVMPRFLKHGGYVCIRAARGGVRMLGLPVPHAIWLKHMPHGADIEQTVPVERKKSRGLALFSFFFKFKVVKHETRR
jgi:hypothetical protein